MTSELDFKAALDAVRFYTEDLPEGAQPHHGTHRDVVGEWAINHWFTIQTALRIADRYAKLEPILKELCDARGFERGQIWENPDGLLMMVVDVRKASEDADKVSYVTEEGESGSFYSTEIWLRGANLIAANRINDIKQIMEG